MKPIRVQIIQPLVPAYRVPFFRRLFERDDLRVRILASKTFPDRKNLVSVETEGDYLDLDHPCVGFFKNRVMWQRGLRLDRDLGKGDVLVLCGNLRLLSNLPLIWKARRKKVGIVWWSHGFSPKRNRLRDIINVFFVRYFDARLLYTDKEIEEYKKLGALEHKLFATNNAIDDAPIREAVDAWDEERLSEFQQREELAGKPTLLFCGRRTDSVSLELVFAALAELKKTGKLVHFVIIGPKDEQGHLEKKAKDLQVDDLVHWLGPMFDQHSLAPWFLSASCFVSPGPIGLALLHSFSYGLPVIASDGSHGPEIAALRDGENGFFFRSGDAKDLTSKISAIINDPNRLKILSASALRTAQRDYNMENMVNRCVSAIMAASKRHRKHHE